MRYYIHSFRPQTTCCDVSSCNKAASGTLWGTVFISFYGMGYKPQEGNENKLLTFGAALLWTFLLGDTDQHHCYWWHWTEQRGNYCVLKNEDQPWIFEFFEEWGWGWAGSLDTVRFSRISSERYIKLKTSVKCMSILTYLLTPWSRVLLEKLTDFNLVKKFPAFYGTRKFITAFTRAQHLSLSWASPIQSVPSHPNSWRSILILSSHLRLGLPSGPFL